MRSIQPIIAASSLISFSAMAAQAFSQTIPAAKEPCKHVRTSFDLLVHAPYAVTAPLFGPNGERAWAGKDWNPEFIHPSPASDVDGAIFAIRRGTHNETWVTTLFDVDAQHFQYVYFLPELMVTVIDVRFKRANTELTAVNVVYTRTALTLKGNERVIAMSEIDKAAGEDWQKAIDDYLASSKTGSNPEIPKVREETTVQNARR